MKIIILGAGQVGTTLAQHMSKEDNSITVVDISHHRLSILQEHLDIKTILGNASYPNILSKAGADEAELIIAVTNSDEVNMIACQMAYSLFQVPTKIARIRALEYLVHQEIFDKYILTIDILISPEQLIARHIKRLIEHPDARQVLDFANKKIQMIEIKVQNNTPFIDSSITNIKENLSNINLQIIAIFRDQESINIKPSTTVKIDDELLFIAENKNINFIISKFCHLSPANKRIIIAGGGNIGTKLALYLENSFKIKIIDHNMHRVEHMAEKLNNSIVLHADCTDQNILIEENIKHTDVFCAVTNSDETNIMSAILAKHLGARKVMALINRPSYVNIISSSDVDIAISPQETTISGLLTHIRSNNFIKAYSLFNGTVEAIEAKATGNEQTSKIIGRTVKQLKLPFGAEICAIVRNNEVFINDLEITIKADDHIIIFLNDKNKISHIEKLFQVEKGLL